MAAFLPEDLANESLNNINTTERVRLTAEYKYMSDLLSLAWEEKKEKSWQGPVSVKVFVLQYSRHVKRPALPEDHPLYDATKFNKSTLKTAAQQLAVDLREQRGLNALYAYDVGEIKLRVYSADDTRPTQKEKERKEREERQKARDANPSASVAESLLHLNVLTHMVAGSVDDDDDDDDNNGDNGKEQQQENGEEGQHVMEEVD